MTFVITVFFFVWNAYHLDSCGCCGPHLASGVIKDDTRASLLAVQVPSCLELEWLSGRSACIGTNVKPCRRVDERTWGCASCWPSERAVSWWSRSKAGSRWPRGPGARSSWPVIIDGILLKTRQRICISSYGQSREISTKHIVSNICSRLISKIHRTPTKRLNGGSITGGWFHFLESNCWIVWINLYRGSCIVPGKYETNGIWRRRYDGWCTYVHWLLSEQWLKMRGLR